MSSILPSYFFYSRDLFLYLELFCGESFFFFTDFFLLCSEEYGLERELVFVWHYFFPPHLFCIAILVISNMPLLLQFGWFSLYSSFFSFLFVFSSWAFLELSHGP